MQVHINEPMRVAPGGHVIDLKPGETADGSLAEYLVATGCNVTVVEDDPAAQEPAVADAGPGDPESVDDGLSASLTATADFLIPAEPEAATKPVRQARAKPVK